MKKSKKTKTPRRKRLNREKRLVQSKDWVSYYKGKNIVKKYRKYYGVDVICAMTELRLLGVEISKEYELSVLKSAEARLLDRKRREAKRIEKLNSSSIKQEFEDWSIMGYTSNGFPFGNFGRDGFPLGIFDTKKSEIEIRHKLEERKKDKSEEESSKDMKRL